MEEMQFHPDLSADLDKQVTHEEDEEEEDEED
jgi:hypothetical protein